MSDTPDTDDVFPYPRGAVVGILDDQAALTTATGHLDEAGLDESRRRVLFGDEGLAQIDVEGDKHGRKGHFIRQVQSAMSDDADHVRRFAEELRAGRYVVGVLVGEDEAAKDRAAAALRAADATFVHFYAENYVEDLSAQA